MSAAIATSQNPRRLREYETIYILESNIDPDEADRVATRLKDIIGGRNGKLLKIDNWGKRKLAYEVKHQKEGIYVLQDFKIGPERVPELESALKITEEVLRHLIVRKPEKPGTTAAAPPPAAVVPEPAAVESKGAAEPKVGDREER